MASRHQQRRVKFEIIDGHLVRTVAFPDGKAYSHRCTQASYEGVAWAVSEAPLEGEGLALQELAESLKLPFTQACIALEFLKERGVAVTRHRRSYPASNFAYEDAMIEFHALREKAGHEG